MRSRTWARCGDVTVGWCHDAMRVPQQQHMAVTRQKTLCMYRWFGVSYVRWAVFLHPHHDVCGMIAAMKNCGSSVCETPFVDKSETCSSGPAAVHTQLEASPHINLHMVLHW